MVHVLIERQKGLRNSKTQAWRSDHKLPKKLSIVSKIQAFTNGYLKIQGFWKGWQVRLVDINSSQDGIERKNQRNCIWFLYLDDIPLLPREISVVRSRGFLAGTTDNETFFCHDGKTNWKQTSLCSKLYLLALLFPYDQCKSPMLQYFLLTEYQLYNAAASTKSL